MILKTKWLDISTNPPTLPLMQTQYEYTCLMCIAGTSYRTLGSVVVTQEGCSWFIFDVIHNRFYEWNFAFMPTHWIPYADVPSLNGKKLIENK